MHLTSYGIAVLIQTSMVELRTPGEASVMVPEDWTVHLYVPIPDATQFVEFSLYLR